MENAPIKIDKKEGIKGLVKSLFRDDFDKPFTLTKRQVEIFEAIFTRGESIGRRRLHIMTYTQYGKSDVVSMAVLLRVSTYPEKFCIVAPTQPKARIIISYLIRHIFDNEYFVSRFKIKKGENIESIRRERSKNRLTFNTGDGIGEVFILTAESSRKGQDVGNAMMGFGAPNVVMDEAALISDEADAKAMRMVGGFSQGGNDFVCKIGNPFTRGHFYEAHNDDNYYKINADYHVGLKEGRLSEKFIEEMKKKPSFEVLYANKFPRADAVDSKGWSNLLTEDEIERAMTREPMKHAGERRLGNDIARGGNNSNTWIIRSMNYAQILRKTNKIEDTTEVAGYTMLDMGEHKILPVNTWIDATGVGGPVYDMIRKENKQVQAFNGGERAVDETRFANKRAEAYWRAAQWIKAGGKLEYNEDWYELATIKYKPDARRRIRIMSKEEMLTQGFESPDVADGFMMTFARGEHSVTESMKRRREHKRRRRQQAGNYHVSMGGYGS